MDRQVAVRPESTLRAMATTAEGSWVLLAQGGTLFTGRTHAWIPGTTWTVQFGFRDAASPGPAGFNFSDAIRVTPVP